MKQTKLGSTFHVGLKHQQDGRICQDFSIAVQDGPITILALSDGMGSYKYAELGAQFVVNFIRENAKIIHDLLESAFIKDENEDLSWKKTEKETFIKKIIGRMQSEAQDYAARIGAGIDDLHCTLSFAIIGPTHMIAASKGRKYDRYDI